MTPKMVANFRRSLSFPNHPNPTQSKPRKTYHVRSASLPNRSHPLISQLKDDISELKSWATKPKGRNSSWLVDGLTRLKTVHEYLDDILQFPQTRESLRHQGEWIEKLLEEFLRFADVYGMFQNIVLVLKEEHSAAQVVVRRRDDLKMGVYLKALKKASKEMGKLVTTVRCCCSEATGPDCDAELADIVRDVNQVTVMVSAALLNGISLPLMSAQKPTWVGLRIPKNPKKGKVEEGIHEFRQVGRESLCGLKKKEDGEVKILLKRMREMEDSIVVIEACSEKLFRSLINTRVSLLNVLTQ